MAECKRVGCSAEAMIYPRYRGYCSNYCRDLDEEIQGREKLEAELAAANERIEKLEAFVKKVAEDDMALMSGPLWEEWAKLQNYLEDSDE